ncbi:MAG TPA: YdcF family protein [Gemmatimonadales bacterium]|nr:YdcF family protein [Gemmatimonadales bacterium]
MIAGSDVVGYLLSGGGVVVCFLAAAAWLAFRPASRRARRVLFVGALVFGVASIYSGQYLVAQAIVGSLKPFQAASVAAARRTAVVVLGSGSIDAEDWDGRRLSVVDRTDAARVLEAARVFKLVDPAIVISSGGNPHPRRRTTPTGETMRDALVTVGVPADRIVVETVSKTTRDEAVIIASMLGERSVEQVILVTSQTHMRRALGAFRAVGIAAIPAIAQEFDRDLPVSRQFLPSDDGLFLAASNAHEMLGCAYYWLRGWWKTGGGS